MRGFGVVALLLMVLALPSVSYSGQGAAKADTSEFWGDFVSSYRHDTLILKYNLVLKNLVPDSMTINIDDCAGGKLTTVSFLAGDISIPHDREAIFRNAEGVPFANEWRTVTLSGNRLRCAGTVRAPLMGHSTKMLSVSAFAYAGADTLPKARCDEWLSQEYGGVYGSICLPTWGYYSSHPNERLDKHGPLVGYDVGLGGGNSRYSFVILTSWSGTGKQFTFSEPLVLRYGRYVGERQRLALGPFGGLKLTKIQHVIDEERYQKLKWGVECGLSVEMPFERLSYSYSTPANGYHTVELLLCSTSGKTGYRMGTLFTARFQDHIWMIQMGFQVEGTVGDGVPLLREDRRPFIIRAIARSGELPMWAVYGVYYGVCKIIGQEPLGTH